MKTPIKRKRKGKRHCPIDIDSLYRHWEWGDKRIDWPRISALLERWEKGEKIPWRQLSHTFIKEGRRVPRERAPRRRRNRAFNTDRGFWERINRWLDDTPLTINPECELATLEPAARPRVRTRPQQPLRVELPTYYTGVGDLLDDDTYTNNHIRPINTDIPARPAPIRRGQ